MKPAPCSLITVTISLLLTGCNALEAQPAPGTQPASPESATVEKPQVSAVAHDPQAVVWLRKASDALQQIRTLQARVSYDEVQPLGLGEDRRYGDLFFRRDPGAPSPKLAVHFDRLRIGGPGGDAETLDSWYIFDGRLLLERDERHKQATLRELAPPGHHLRLEDAGVPVPLDLDIDRMLTQNRAASCVIDEGAGLVTIELLPVVEADNQPARLELVIHQNTALPKAITVEQPGGEMSVVKVLQPQLGGALDEKLFRVLEQVPDSRAGWDVEVVEFDPQQAGAVQPDRR